MLVLRAYVYTYGPAYGKPLKDLVFNLEMHFRR
jgi:hypothetical protein